LTHLSNIWGYSWTSLMYFTFWVNLAPYHI